MLDGIELKDHMHLPVNIEAILNGKTVESERLEFNKGLDLVEGRGTGIPKIMRAIRKNKSPRPTFETDDDRTYFAARFPIHPKAKKKAQPTMQVTAQVTAQVTPQVTPPVTPPVAKLMEVLSDKGEMGNADIRKELKLKDRAHLREHYVEPAISDGLIEYTIPAKPNSRFQKYRLTEKGRNLLKSFKKS